MPWQLPQEDIDMAWSLIYSTTLRWELRYAGGIKVAIDEVRFANNLPCHAMPCLAVPCHGLETIPPNKESCRRCMHACTHVRWDDIIRG